MPFHGCQSTYQDFCRSGGSLVHTVNSVSSLYFHTHGFCSIPQCHSVERVWGGWGWEGCVWGVVLSILVSTGAWHHFLTSLFPFSCLPSSQGCSTLEIMILTSCRAVTLYSVIWILATVQAHIFYLLLGPFQSVCPSKVSSLIGISVPI